MPERALDPVKQAELDHEVEVAREHWDERLAFDPLTAESDWLEQKKRRILGWLEGDPVRRILDFGAASCEMSEILAERGHFVVAGDVCLDLLVISRQRAGRLGHRRPHYVVLDGESLPFRDGAFPRVLCWAVLHHFVRPERPAAEILRVLAAGGRALFTEPLSTNPFRLAFEFRFRRQHDGVETSFRRAELMGRLRAMGYGVEDVAYQSDLLPEFIFQARRGLHRLVTHVRLFLSRRLPRLFGSVSFVGVKP